MSLQIDPSPSPPRNGQATRTRATLRWHESAPAKLRKGSESADPSGLGEAALWEHWQAHLADRREPRSIQRLTAARVHPLLWSWAPSLDDSALDDDLVPTVSRALTASGRHRRRWLQLAEIAPLWLRESDGARPTIEFAGECLAWAHALPRLASVMSAEPWCELLRRLIDLATEPRAEMEQEPVVWQMLAGELPLTLAYHLPELANVRELTPRAGDIVSAGLDHWLDDAASPRVEPLTTYPALIATWTRSQALVRHSEQGKWEKSARRRFAASVLNGLRLLRRDGSLVFGESAPLDEATADMWRVAALSTGRRGVERVRRWTIDAKQPRGKAPSLPASLVGEASRLAVMRTDWSRPSPRVTLRYRRDAFDLEWGTAGEILGSGRVIVEIEQGGKPVEPAADWTQACWVSDRDADYLELERHYDQGLRLQRHILLAHEDQFLFWADALILPADCSASDLGYQVRYPLHADVALSLAERTVEASWRGRKARGRIFPLGLPEWRSEARGGELLSGDAEWILRQRASGVRALFCPWFIDLARDRQRQACTWRGLTIAEERHIVPADVAVGYRVQVGKRQWMFYRSLLAGQSRTLLGHHLTHEFLAARFTSRGTVDTLLAIESEGD